MEVDLASSPRSSFFFHAFFFGYSFCSRFLCCSVVQGHAAPADEKRLEEACILFGERDGPLLSLPEEDGYGRLSGLEFEVIVSVPFFSFFCFFFVPGGQPAADPGRLSIRSLPKRSGARKK